MIYKQCRNLIAAWLIVQLAVSCEKLMLAPDPSIDPIIVFEHLHTDLANRYAYFEEKGINWEETGNRYRAMINPDLSQYELFYLLSDMLFELRDGHVNIRSSFDRSRNWSWFQDYPANYDQNLIDSAYLRSDFKITGPLYNQIIDSVLYINYRSFTETIRAPHLDHIMLRAKGMKGVIIDIRSNGGGNLGNAYSLASCFSDSELLFARQRIKNGPGPDDFSAWQDLKLTPRNGLRFGGPVIVLTNRRSYSAATFFTQMMKTLPNAIIIGDNTGGGGGIPAFGELPNGWQYRFSASQTVNPQGQHIEPGVEADLKIGLHPADQLKGKDTIIEAALSLLKSS